MGASVLSNLTKYYAMTSNSPFGLLPEFTVAFFPFALTCCFGSTGTFLTCTVKVEPVSRPAQGHNHAPSMAKKDSQRDRVVPAAILSRYTDPISVRHLNRDRGHYGGLSYFSSRVR